MRLFELLLFEYELTDEQKSVLNSFEQQTRGDPRIIKWINSQLKNYIGSGQRKNLQEISHVIDFMKSKEVSHKKSFNYSIPDAIKASHKWTEYLNKHADETEDKEGIKEVKKYKDGTKWIQLFSSQALNREGKLMKHCVGSYCSEVSAGTMQYIHFVIKTTNHI